MNLDQSSAPSINLPYIPHGVNAHIALTMGPTNTYQSDNFYQYTLAYSHIGIHLLLY